MRAGAKGHQLCQRELIVDHRRPLHASELARPTELRGAEGGRRAWRGAEVARSAGVQYLRARRQGSRWWLGPGVGLRLR